MSKYAFPLIICLFWLSTTAQAQTTPPEDPIQPDRPDFTQGAQTLEKGRFQIEGGTTRDRSGPEHSLTIGETQLRIGTSSRSELRIGLPSYVRTRDQGTHAAGIDDPTIGARFRLSGEHAKTAFAIIAETSVPVGSRRVIDSRYEPDIVLAAELPKLGAFSLTTNLGYGRVVNPDDHFAQIWGTVSAEVDLSKRVGSFFEFYAFNREESVGPVHKFADTGLTYLLNPDLQLDARIGFGLNNHVNGPNYFYGFGASQRF